MNRKKNREIEATLVLSLSAKLPEKRKYFCELYFDNDLIDTTSLSEATCEPDWSRNRMEHNVLEKTKQIRIVLYTIINRITRKINEQVGELRIPFSNILSSNKIDKKYNLSVAKNENEKEKKAKEKAPEIRLVIECTPTELYRKNLLLEKRRKMILGCPLPKVEIPELMELMNLGESEDPNDSRLTLIKSSKNWKWITGESLRKKNSKTESILDMGMLSSEPKSNNLRVEEAEEDITSGYKMIGKDDSDEENNENNNNNDKEGGYTQNEQNYTESGGNHYNTVDEDEDNDVGYKEIAFDKSPRNDDKDEKINSPKTNENIDDRRDNDDENEGSDDDNQGYMIIDDDDDDEETTTPTTTNKNNKIENNNNNGKAKDPKKMMIQSVDSEGSEGGDKSSSKKNSLLKSSASNSQLTSSGTLYNNDVALIEKSSSPKENTKEISNNNNHSSPTPPRDKFEYESFNNRFQKLIEKLDELKQAQNTHSDETQETNMKLIQLAQDFVASATIYGKLIISEHQLPWEMRTIKSTNKVGGCLGGEKYIVNDILFKFANDAHGIFANLKDMGHDPMWAANKVAGHELKGCIDYFRARPDGLSFPLMALVDYKGYRLIAMSILPLNGSQTLKYGSNDAGQDCNVLTESPELTNKIETASKSLNLKGHWCGRKGRDKLLYSAIDLEGHVSDKDGRMYVIDYSRSMPPVYPKGKQGIYGQQFYCLFRSEFVKSYKMPLSPDGFSNFQSRDAKVHNEEIKEATIYLVKEKIPKIAVELINKFKEHLNTVTDKSQKPIFKFSLSGNLHTLGINMRYAGLLLEYVPENEELFDLIFVEIAARIVKNRLRHLMRKKLEKVRAPLEAPFNILIINNLNGLLSGDRARDFLQKKSKNYWEKHIPSQMIPLFKLSEERMKKLGDLKDRISKINFHGNVSGKYLLLTRITEMMGLKFTGDIMEELNKNSKIFELNQIFEYTDLKDIGVRVKHMNIIETIQAEMFLTYYLHRGKLQLNDVDALRQYKKALVAIEEEVKKRPTDPLLITKFANIINKVEKAQFRIEKKSTNNVFPLLSNPNLIRASKYYEKAINLQPMDTLVLTEFAQFAYFWGDVSKAEDFFLRSLEVDPNQIEALKSYGNLLLKQSSKLGSSFLSRSGHIAAQQSIIENFLAKNIDSNQAAEKLKQIESEHDHFCSSFSTEYSSSVLRSSKNLNTTL